MITFIIHTLYTQYYVVGVIIFGRIINVVSFRAVPYGYGGERTACVRLTASHIPLLDVLSLLRLVADSDDAAHAAAATVRPEVVVCVRGRRLRRRWIVARRQQVGLLLVVEMLLLGQATPVRALIDGRAVRFGHFDLVPGTYE